MKAARMPWLVRFGPAFAAAILALAIAACSSGSQQTSPPKVSKAEATRDVVDGKARLTSTIKVSMDRDFKFADSHLPVASQFDFTVPVAGGGTRRVLVQTADRSTTDNRLITLTTNELVPDGSTLHVQKKLFDGKGSGVVDAKVTADLDATMVLLASKALGATAPGFFDTPVQAPVSDQDRDAAAQRAVLQKHMQDRGSDPQTLQDALDIYDAIPVQLVASPKLRAALAALTGTFAEPALGYLLSSSNCTSRPVARIAFQAPPDNPDLTARVTFTGNGARVISINPYAEGERIEYLMPILAHEAIHCDNDDGLIEEVSATSFDGLLYIQLMSALPELADGRTKLARELNVDAIGLINSGQRLPESIGVLKSPGVSNILPDTNKLATSFAEFVAAAYPSVSSAPSPTEPLAQTYADILAEGAGMPKGDAFDLRYLDELVARSIDAKILTTDIVALQLQPAG